MHFVVHFSQFSHFIFLSFSHSTQSIAPVSQFHSDTFAQKTYPGAFSHQERLSAAFPSRTHVHPYRAFFCIIQTQPSDIQKSSDPQITAFFSWASQIRTGDCRSQSPVPYRLAIAQYYEKDVPITQKNIAKRYSGRLFTSHIGKDKRRVDIGIRTLGLQSHNLAR